MKLLPIDHLPEDLECCLRLECGLERKGVRLGTTKSNGKELSPLRVLRHRRVCQHKERVSMPCNGRGSSNSREGKVVYILDSSNRVPVDRYVRERRVVQCLVPVPVHRKHRCMTAEPVAAEMIHQSLRSREGAIEQELRKQK